MIILITGRRKGPRQGETRIWQMKEDPDLFDQYFSESWESEHIFKCLMCNETVQGFEAALDHARDSHPPDVSEDETATNYTCIVCTQNFRRKEQARKHLESHVKGENLTDEEDEPLKATTRTGTSSY